ncbi:hypothetical protein JL475_00220 [Streptomyces sp. M2CJ-2]|uniref:hypothetical protein n=1 Tax=Streptomyces sp. M2CJ-2 TaxID=2803948 RepID=UPI001924936E|nr:hypothetical protein [Streptomyces sp. M2CJ-2]MBL3664470.1 hypothetical protein [Streptomyces sp. M2CJ-2]
MTTAKPGANIPAKPSTRRKYITPTTERLLRDCFPGMVPAAVVEEAVRQHAIREGRLTAPSNQTRRKP